MARGASTTSNAASVTGGIRNLKELVPEFDASENTFWRWKNQVELIRNTYRLEDDATRILISSRLKGRALTWFHSKSEHLTLSVDGLLEAMQQIFDLRPKKLSLRKEFEARIWKAEESFCDYYHDKVISANRVPVEEDELLDYLVDGIPDTRLQNQARIMNFSSKTDLLKAFEKITLDAKRSSDSKQKKDGLKSSQSKAETSSTKGRTVKCYKCQAVGHIATQCKQSTTPSTKRACYVCGSAGHLARDCSERKQQAASETGEKLTATTTSTNLVQTAVLRKPYLVTVKIRPSENTDKTDTYIIDAIIDSGSPISLIRNSIIENEVCSPVDTETNQFCGINGTRLEILKMFDSNVEIKGVRTPVRFYTVPDNAMAYKVLLGRDFIACPTLRITLGDTVEIESIAEENAKQVLNVEISGNCQNRDELQINPAIGRDNLAKINELYESCYVQNFHAEKCEPDFEMNIAVKHEQPISSRPRRLSFADKDTLRKMLDELLERKIIRPSNSPYASPIVLVRKKTGGLRLCIDYRELNKITIRDNFPTELIEDNLDCLQGKKYFTMLDLKDGFHHVKMHEASIKFTSFVTPLGQYEYLRMPFGLTNAPRVFQRFVHQAFAPLTREHKILLYLDDIMVATEALDEHIDILSELFTLAGKNQLQFRLDKCYFAQTEVRYLGYCVNEHGIRPSDENIESVLNYPIPRNVKEVHRFVGLASYFRRFIPKFSLLAKPLFDLIKKNVVFNFGTAENDAFETLKRHLASKPVLTMYSSRLDTELHCDASASGFGGILLQKQDSGLWKPVSFWSQRTTPTESKYHSYELECLAVVYALKRFHVYLAGRKFRIVTDCDSFRLTLDKKDINPRISRWALFLQNYNYEIVHRPGKRMSHVDALSRCHSVLVLEGSTFERTLSICQDRDTDILRIRDQLEKSEMKYYELRDGLVYRKDKNKKLLFYVPRSMEPNVIRTCHDDIGHVGIDKVIKSIVTVYWFPNMREKVKEYIGNCLRCVEFSPLSGKAEGFLHSIPKEELPFVTIHIDHMGPLEKTGKGYRHLLVVIDAFTKFIRVYPCKTTASEESVKCLREYFRAYSKPKRLISDRGTCFTSDAFKEFLKSREIEHTLVAVSTPRANGQVERFNRIITPMLAKLSESPSKWDHVLDKVEYALNNTVCRTINETPSRLLFGIEQRGESNDIVRDVLRTAIDRDLEQMRKKAHTNIKESQLENAKRYNLRRKPAREYKVGDYVEVRNIKTTPGVNKKLLPKFKGPYVIKKVLDYDRYVITDLDGFQLTQRPYTGVVAPDQMRPYIHSL
ncbi:PREDICTED: uncharacterized protein K02A2.6-like [Vollenhovia emeryi]|uniref:uncharacterized protein K02A2.6-like n=1 Tax=Vollenhovia emeryi TaxID=411798 RepID=UPI0005F4A5A6|nr:PREDICTED: uncharacterized protein K02A2.6-like [Vollenhovia emeryi]